MISNRIKKRFSRIVAGLVSAAMTFTMVPDVWLPVYADSVRNEIADADIYSDDNTEEWDMLSSLDPMSEEYAELKAELTAETGISSFSLRGASLNGTLLSNDYIAVNAASNGRFTIGTTGGDPARSTDNNKKLIYGHPGGNTSFTTVRVNGTSYVYQINNSSFNEEEGYNISFGNFGGLDVEQKLTLKENPATGREDTVEIKYTVKNNTEETHAAGLRIMMDTMLGSNDAAPFRVPQYGSITTETEFSGCDIPQFWQAFDNLTNPTVIAQGRFYSSAGVKPDKVQFTSWSRVRNTYWGYTVKPEYSNGDSAVSVIWEEDALAPGESREYITYYGLSEFSEDLSLPLALSVYSDSSISVAGGKYIPDPVDVTAYVQNVSGNTADDVSVRIELPEGLKLADGSEKVQYIGTMAAGQLQQSGWKVKMQPVSTAKTYTYNVVLTAADGYTKTVSRMIYVPAIQRSEKIYEYTVFSANQNEDITLNGWKSNFTGGIYSGRNFVCNLSEFYLDGKVDAAGTVTANGWKINIPEKNENIEAIAMPDLEEAILAKAGEYTYYAESPSYIQDTNIINGSIMVSGDVTISGTNFEGDCYIIADKDITYNVNNLNTTGRLVLYSRNGNITVNGTNISIDGIMYAPKGKVSFNANETTVNGRIWGDTVNFSGSIFNIKGSDSDLDLIGEAAQRGITKTYTTSEDFSEGTLDGVSLAVPDQLILAENAGGDKIPVQKVYGDSQTGNGIKITYSADTSAISHNGEAVNISYGLSGFGEVQNNENAVDLIIVVDESGSMSGSRMANAKSAAKEVVAQMKPGDRCALVGFNYYARVIQTLTDDKVELNSAIDKLRASGSNNICNGLQSAIEQFNDDSRQKYIMLISDGEDGSASAAMAATAGEKGIRILAMMVGTGSLQMQTVAINSNGIYKNAPTAEDIGKIMTYFASEVFNTAGRNTTFKATVKDKNSVDLSAVTPAPASITEHSDGSITLEWFFDRISIDETETINLPVTANADGEFAELITDISCVYYDKNGKPGVIYADDAVIPVSKYASSGSWTAVFDSEQANTAWSGIFWNGIRYGDGNIGVTASVSEDGVTFGEAVPVRNYAPLSGLTGRYIKLNVDMTASSDGKTPELFDITVTEENIPENDNSEANAAIYAKLGTKVNVPVTVRGIVSDDCLADDLSFEWSCIDGNVTFADKNALITSAIFSSEGEYEIKLTVNDGEKTAVALFGIIVSPADKYEDIDPESGEASAPEISVKLPQYADRYQKISAKIENLNNTEISWYSVIFNDRTAVEVSDSGEFTLTMPGSNGTYKVVVRAFDWSGKSDVKEYTIIVNSETPTIEILPSAEKIFTGEEAYFTVNTTLADKINTVEYTLNGEAVSILDGKYTLDTANAGTYTLMAKAVTNSNKTITASASIEVIKASTPIVDLVFDKELYSEGDDVIVTVVAEDENGIAGIALEYNYQQVQLDENNSFRIENITAGEHTLVGIAWNAAGIVSSAGYSITIEPAEETIITIEALVDDTEIYLGETARLTVNVNGGDGTERISVDVNGNALSSDTNVYEYIPGAVGEYVFNVTVETASGDSKTVSVTVNVTEPYTPPEQDVSAPSVELSLNKDIYYEGDDIIITVKAEDNIGVTNTVVTVNGEALSADENGRFVIKNAAVSTYDIKATAYDAAGNSAWTSVSVPVNNKGSEPADELTLEVDIDTSKVKVGEPFDINITANGGVGEKTISCTVNNESVAVENSKASYTPEQFGTYDIAVSAVDEAGSNITKIITLTINESGADIGGGSEEKIVTVSLIINDDRINDGNHNEAKVGDEVSVFVEIKNLSDDEIESLVVTVNGEEIVLDSDKKAVYIPEKADEYLFKAILTAKDGNVSDLKYMLYVTGNGGGENPDDPDDDELYVDITSPEDVKEITAPTDIIGSAKGSGLVKYTLEYAPAGTDEFTAICEGREAVDSGVIGQLDPTMLRNGYYDIRLTGYTGKAHKSDVITVYVTGQMKIGNFSIAFQDMDVNVPGLALTVVRGYDSRDKSKSGDFGYGWNLSMTSADISESGKPSENWSQTQSGGLVSAFKFSEDKAHEVSIDWGNGKTEKFRMALSPNSSLTPITAGITVSYKAQKGTKSTLEPINKGVSALVYNDDTLMYSDGTPYAPSGYKLTKQDGTVYYFDADGNVTKIIDTNGSTIEMTYDGIIHSDGKSINYNRDSEGRITSIVSPTGKTVEYTYDNNGDLTAVKDISGYVTKFEYDEHYITNIIDPRGVSVSRNIYDDSGRLIKTIDSDGNEIVYDHDIDGRQEVITDRNGNVTLYVYDDNGNILSQTDPNGNTVKNTYDSNGNLDKTVDALGNVTDYGYSESGDLITLTDAEGHTVTNSYNSKGQLTSINAMGIKTITVAYDDKGNTTSTTDAMGNDIDYSYDGKGQLTSVTDEIGSYMNMTYDSEGNVISATNGAGTTSQFTYDTDGNCTSKTLTYTSEEGVKTVTEQYFYDNAGNLIKIIDSDGNVTTTEYNTMGKVSSATDEKGRKTTYEYDDFGNLVKITYPDNTTETFTYDREGNNLSATDRMGRTVTMKYDKVGNLLSKTYPNGASVSYEYDKNYNLIKETNNVTGAVTSYEYDKINRNTAIVDALGNRTAFFYNAKSQLESMTDPMGRTYIYSYDDNGNRIKTTYPDGTSVSSAYDARGRVTRQTDQHGYSTRYVYDGADRLVRVTNAQGVFTSYTYDEVGNMTSVTDGNGNVTAYAYDDFGRVVKTTNALGNSAYTTYDNSGNVLTVTDYAGNVTTYTYDNLDRLTGKSNNDGTVNYTYTTDGKISAVTDSTGITTFTYDLMDGLTRVDYPDGNYVEYSYDNACRLTKVITPFGSTSYEYDLLDRLTRVVDRNGYATVYEYDANGNRTAVHYANGFTTTYDYDLLNRLIKQETLDSEDNIVVQYIYTLGVAGERRSVTELDRTVEYTYDSLYRLTSETITEGEKTTVYTYAYDNVSNRTLKTENGTETEYVYNALNQLVSDSETSFEYDLNGNLVRVIGSAHSALYEYNSENKLIKATVQNGSLVIEESYTYDYEGNRTSKTTHKSNGEFEYTKYLNDNSSLTNVLAEIDENGTVKCTYTIGADLISQERDGRTSFYLYDGHGSVVGLANESGVVTDTYSYDAFGNLLKSTGSNANNYRYCGEQFDETTGLYYLRARYMDTSTGRFISQDSYAGSISDPTSLHKYLYANANPVTYSDPSGYSVEKDISLYQGLWLSIDQALDYEQRLLGSIGNDIAYNANVVDIGKELLYQLGMTFLEYTLTNILEPYVGPNMASFIASGIVSSIDIVVSARYKSIKEQSGFTPPSTNDDYVTVYRGTDRYREIEIADATGCLMSDSMLNSFQGDNFDEAFRNAERTHQEWIDLWGNEQYYAEAHGAFGLEMPREFHMDRTLISATTDVDVARQFGSKVYEIRVPRSSIIRQTLTGSGESEVLLRIAVDNIRRIT